VVQQVFLTLWRDPRFQTEVLAALGKHWDRPAQGGDARVAQGGAGMAARGASPRPGRAARASRRRPGAELVAESARPGGDAGVADQPATAAVGGRGRGRDGGPRAPGRGRSECGRRSSGGLECEDLNCPVPDAAPWESETARLTVATARRLRRLYDIEAAALATAAVLLGRPAPDVLATARVSVAIC
jgi:hypothetical protein